MSAVVADTHAFIWYLFEPTLLSVRAKAALTLAETDPGLIYVPSICLVEVRYLVEKGTLGEDVFTQLVSSLLDTATLQRWLPWIWILHEVSQEFPGQRYLTCRIGLLLQLRCFLICP